MLQKIMFTFSTKLHILDLITKDCTLTLNALMYLNNNSNNNNSKHKKKHK